MGPPTHVPPTYAGGEVNSHSDSHVVPSALHTRGDTMRATIASRERGAASTEHLGVIVVAVLILAGLLGSAAVFGAQINAYVSAGICRVGSAVGGNGPGDCAPDLPPEVAPPDFVPTDCIVGTTSDRKEGDVSIAIVDGGIGRTVDTKHVQSEDGDYYLVTVNNDGELGLGTGAGGGLASGKKDMDGASAGVQVDLSGKGRYIDGTTYRVETAEEAEALAQELYDHGNDGAGDADLWADSTTWQGEGTLSGDAGLTGTYSRENRNGEQRDGEVNAASVSGSGQAQHSWQSTYNHDTGHTTYVTTWNGTLDGQFDTMMGGVDGTVGWGSAIAITRDENNQIVKIKIVQISESGASGNVGLDQSETHGAPPVEGPDDRTSAGGNAGFTAGDTDKTVTTIDLPVHDGNRQTVDTWLNSQTSWGDDWMPFTPFTTGGWDPLVTSSDPMQQLLHEEAMVSRVTTRDSRTVEEMGFSIKWGLKFGASYTLTQTDGEVVAAEYAGPPSGGQRPWEAMDACF